jgi:flagellar assembly protein FliH
MTSSAKPLAPLLRGVQLQPQPRVLSRPQRGPSVPQSGGAGSLAAPAQATSGRPIAAVVPAPVAAPVAAPAPLPEEVFEQARAKGLQEGREAGLQLGPKDAQERLAEATRAAQAAAAAEVERESARLAQQCLDRVARIDAMARAFEERLASHCTALEAEAALLAFDAVCRLLGDAVGRRDTVEALVGQAMSALRSQPVRVRLNAADLALLDEGEPRGASGLRARHPGIEWIADAAVPAGGCLIDSAGGTLDARLDTQLQRLLQHWRAVLGGEAQG